MNQAAAAFAAGLVSFATPRVPPLVPAYMSAIGAGATDPGRALITVVGDITPADARTKVEKALASLIPPVIDFLAGRGCQVA